MAQENSTALLTASFGARAHFAALRANAPLQPTVGAHTIDLRGSFNSGQALAGSGVLSFEGEILEGPRFPVH